jgi:hypothetical protein
MRKATLLVGLLMISGCQLLSYTTPQGETFTRFSFGPDVMFQGLHVAKSPTTMSVDIQGYKSESHQALETVSQALSLIPRP